MKLLHPQVMSFGSPDQRGITIAPEKNRRSARVQPRGSFRLSWSALGTARVTQRHPATTSCCVDTWPVADPTAAFIASVALGSRATVAADTHNASGIGKRPRCELRQGSKRR